MAKQEYHGVTDIASCSERGVQSRLHIYTKRIWVLVANSPWKWRWSLRHGTISFGYDSQEEGICIIYLYILASLEGRLLPSSIIHSHFNNKDFWADFNSHFHVRTLVKMAQQEHLAQECTPPAQLQASSGEHDYELLKSQIGPKVLCSGDAI
jgi:hypothetical protein